SRYADLFDFAPVGYVTFDAQGRIQEANLTAAALLSVERGLLIGSELSKVVRLRDQAAFHDHLRRCFSDRVRVSTELALFVLHRGDVQIHMIRTPTIGPDGTVTSCRTTMSDITPLKQSEAVLRFLADAGEALSSSLDYTTTLATVARLAVPVLADVCCLDIV